MAKLARFPVLMPKRKLEEYDEWLEEKGFATRTEAIRAAIRKQMEEDQRDKQ